MNPPEIKRFRISKWIMLALAVLSNCFIVFYSSIDDNLSNEWNRSFSNFFVNLINTFSPSKNKDVPLEEINISFSNEDNYIYNYLPGYALEQIPLGSAKQIECSFLPINASNKSITYSAFPSDAVILNQSGSILSVVGMKTEKCVITARSDDGGFQSSINLEIVNTVAPDSYDISLPEYEVSIGQTKTIDIDIDGGPLGHDELINFRYYDTRKLSYSSLNENIATVEDGVIYPHKIGKTVVRVSNGTITKSFDIKVNDGVAPTPYSDLKIEGPEVCFNNDMISDQNSKKDHYQLIPKDGDKELNPDDFIWSSSDELLAKVDRYGVVRGFRKTSIEDETVTITAISKLTGQMASFDIDVRHKIPTFMNVYMDIEGKRIWDQKEYTASVGENIDIKVIYNSPATNNNLIVSSSDTNIVSVTNEGSVATLHFINEGTCVITIESVINPSLTFETKYTVVAAGSISAKDTKDVEYSLRKIFGHAAVFMVSQIFTFLAIYMFLYSKKWWFYSSISLGEGLFIACLSEFIQFLAPGRDSTFRDILINFSGVLVGALLTFLVISLIKITKNRKENKKRAE